MPLTPLPSTRLSDVVEERICAYIKENNLQPGDSLPKETELADSLNVSRNIVREALSRLRMFGLIKSKKRKGMVVAEPDILAGVEKLVTFPSLGQDTARELFELRLVIELGLTELIFLRMTEDDLDYLEDLITQEQNVSSNKKRIECDIAFHKRLYKMAGNDILSRFQNILTLYFSVALEKLPKPKEQKHHVSHSQLLDILRNGTPDQFRNAMKEHLQDLFEHFCLQDDNSHKLTQ